MAEQPLDPTIRTVSQGLQVLETVSQVDGQTPFFTHISEPTDIPGNFPPPSEPFPEIRGYTIVEKLGKGGMGAVYLARQSGLNRLVALKMALTGETGSTLRFLAECEAIAAIRHKNVVEVYQFGEHEGRPFLSMEYCPGGSLKDRIAKTPKFDPRGVAELIAKIAAGVGAAHAAGIVHRDLKPDNIVFTAEGEPKVADFGLAKLGGGSDLTKTSAQMGTPYYMPPEQARGDTKFVGPQADVWALGIMLYELLTGERPFKGATNWDIMGAVIRGTYMQPHKLNPKTSRDLELICAKCLQSEPGDRYPSATSLAEDLQNWKSGRPIVARPPGPIESGMKWVKRNKTIAVAALAVALILVSATAVALSFAIESRKSAENARRALDERDDAVNKEKAIIKKFLDFIQKNPDLASLPLTVQRQKFQEAFPDISQEELVAAYTPQLRPKVGEGGGQSATSVNRTFDGD